MMDVNNNLQLHAYSVSLQLKKKLNMTIYFESQYEKCTILLFSFEIFSQWVELTSFKSMLFDKVTYIM